MLSSITKYLIAAGAGAALCYAVIPRKTVTVVVTDTKKQTDVEKDKRKETTIVEKVGPDGSKQTTTKIVEDTSTKRVVDERSHTSDTRETTFGGGGFGASLLVASSGSLVDRDYGVSVNKSILGPINVGAFFFKSGTIGVSAGLQF